VAVIFHETDIPGAWVIDLEYRADSRGFFARAFCAREFEAHGINATVVQCNLSYSHARGTLRGMHYQLAPQAEAKLVRCTAGAIFDVIVDLRPGSAAYCRWYGVELTASNRRMLYAPEGCAHGYLTLVDGTDVFYQVSAYYAPEAERGVRWNDSAFGIRWPFEPSVISERDRAHPDFVP
jgi:dTDP-4-dehydrorhamnose 3,5-epimerase